MQIDAGVSDGTAPLVVRAAPGHDLQRRAPAPPGGLLEVSISDSDVAVTERSWWSLGDTLDAAIDDRSTLTLDEAAQQLETLLADAVAMRLESDVPLGSFLSGGIDSSLISALAQRAQPDRTLRTFTVSMPELGFDESQHAATVARHLGTDHQDGRPLARRCVRTHPATAGHLGRAVCRPVDASDRTALPGRPPAAHRVPRRGRGGRAVRRLQPTRLRRVDLPPGDAPPASGERIAAGLLAPSPCTIDKASHVVSRVLPAGRRIPNAGTRFRRSAHVSSAEVGRGTRSPDLAASDLGTDARLAVGAAPVRSGRRGRTVDARRHWRLPDQCSLKAGPREHGGVARSRGAVLDHRLLEWARAPTSIKTSGGSARSCSGAWAERVFSRNRRAHSEDGVRSAARPVAPQERGHGRAISCMPPR